MLCVPMLRLGSVFSVHVRGIYLEFWIRISLEDFDAKPSLPYATEAQWIWGSSTSGALPYAPGRVALEPIFPR